MFLKGSVDGSTWTEIKTHSSDTALSGASSTATWSLETAEYFSVFRLRMTDSNQGGHYKLTCAGFEIYGEVSVLGADKDGMTSPSHNHDIDDTKVCTDARRPSCDLMVF